MSGKSGALSRSLAQSSALGHYKERSWAYPTHEPTLTDMQQPYLDLGVAGITLTLAELDALVGDKLDPRLGRRIRFNIAISRGIDAAHPW